MNAQVDVQAVLDAQVQRSYNPFEPDNQAAWYPHLVEARAAVLAALVASKRTVRAFESLGKASGVMPNLEAHRECEAALVDQKAALARCGAIA